MILGLFLVREIGSLHLFCCHSASHLHIFPLHIPYLECVWPSQWSQPVHGQQGHKGWWESSGLCQAAEGLAWQIAFLALPLGGGTRWCWRNLCHRSDKNMKYKQKLHCPFTDAIINVINKSNTSKVILWYRKLICNGFNYIILRAHAANFHSPILNIGLRLKLEVNVRSFKFMEISTVAVSSLLYC